MGPSVKLKRYCFIDSKEEGSVHNTSAHEGNRNSMSFNLMLFFEFNHPTGERIELSTFGIVINVFIH